MTRPELDLHVTAVKMAKDMQKIDMAKEFVNLSESDKHYVRKLESMNLKRATNTKAMRSRSRYAGALLGVAVFGICILA